MRLTDPCPTIGVDFDGKLFGLFEPCCPPLTEAEKPDLFNPCGCRVYRREIDLAKIAASGGNLGQQAFEEYIGHEWISCGNKVFDNPPGFQDNPETGRNEQPNWIWGTTKKSIGTIQYGKAKNKRCKCATCDDIVDCLQAVENKNAKCSWGKEGAGIFPPPPPKMNCRYHVVQSLQSCCLKRNIFPDKAIIGPDVTFEQMFQPFFRVFP